MQVFKKQDRKKKENQNQDICLFFHFKHQINSINHTHTRFQTAIHIKTKKIWEKKWKQVVITTNSEHYILLILNRYIFTFICYIHNNLIIQVLNSSIVPCCCVLTVRNDCYKRENKTIKTLIKCVVC